MGLVDTNFQVTLEALSTYSIASLSSESQPETPQGRNSSYLYVSVVYSA
jgi:hypothetical protein